MYTARNWPNEVESAQRAIDGIIASDLHRKSMEMSSEKSTIDGYTRPIEVAHGNSVASTALPNMHFSYHSLNPHLDHQNISSMSNGPGNSLEQTQRGQSPCMGGAPTHTTTPSSATMPSSSPTTPNTPISQSNAMGSIKPSCQATKGERTLGFQSDVVQRLNKVVTNYKSGLIDKPHAIAFIIAALPPITPGEPSAAETALGSYLNILESHSTMLE
ncbi:hypothetical protein CPB84DRAFT_1746968 [Gymnopilus junonius]|uniref:Uncharacterized protein n=1 Tax=Gymnopilus junonius TaxID=109634 RepID=A0A9P5NLS5_GYMJU|nr:hypothetical protein CPB84DRAFT_1746968 [Gymnopilus junonius]